MESNTGYCWGLDPMPPAASCLSTDHQSPQEDTPSVGILEFLDHFGVGLIALNVDGVELPPLSPLGAGGALSFACRVHYDAAGKPAMIDPTVNSPANTR